MQVSVIIVNYNTKQLTLNCIESIYKHTCDVDFEIIVVDNASSDGTVEAVEVAFPEVRVIKSSENLGFGRANNLGAKYAKGEFLLLLNSDTLLVENSIQKMLDFYLTNQDFLNVGAIGCILTDEWGNSINSGGVFPKSNNYIRSYIGRVSESFTIDETVEYQQIDFVTGADLFISKQCYDGVSGFDESFFLYYEETDLQRRLVDLGYQNYLFNRTKIIHLEGGSDLGKKISNFKRMIIHQSRNRYLRKHDSRNYYKYVFVDFFINIGRFIKLDYSLAEKISFLKSTIKSYIGNYEK